MTLSVRVPGSEATMSEPTLYRKARPDEIGHIMEVVPVEPDYKKENQMMLYCSHCKSETEHDELFEDRFDPTSWSGHYQVSAGMACLECGTEYEEEEVE